MSSQDPSDETPGVSSNDDQSSAPSSQTAVESNRPDRQVNAPESSGITIQGTVAAATNTTTSTPSTSNNTTQVITNEDVNADSVTDAGPSTKESKDDAQVPLDKAEVTDNGDADVDFTTNDDAKIPAKELTDGAAVRTQAPPDKAEMNDNINSATDGDVKLPAKKSMDDAAVSAQEPKETANGHSNVDSATDAKSPAKESTDGAAVSTQTLPEKAEVTVNGGTNGDAKSPVKDPKDVPLSTQGPLDEAEVSVNGNIHTDSATNGDASKEPRPVSTQATTNESSASPLPVSTEETGAAAEENKNEDNAARPPDDGGKRTIFDRALTDVVAEANPSTEDPKGDVPVSTQAPIDDNASESSPEASSHAQEAAKPSKDRKTGTACGCKCLKSCNCQCACIREDHCYCQSECKGNCRDQPKGRNLVISVDGTSNTFCTTNTNVIELHSRIRKFVGDDEQSGMRQLKCYLSGIGTALPPSAWLLQHVQIKLENVFDLAVAGRFPRTVQDAYRWLMENYQPGDRIFLFGFSRGAYQVRTLAGMIHSLGILEQGNRTLIPFAYNLYLSMSKYQELRSVSEDAVSLARHFKATFSINYNVQVHFLGAWDTVSSLGVFRELPLPLTHATDHLCFFRHALALDECRVKFIPEYLDPSEQPQDDRNQRTKTREANTGKFPAPKAQSGADSSSAQNNPTGEKGSLGSTQNEGGDGKSSLAPNAETTRRYRRDRVKEVWFAGSHSDIGGGYKQNAKLNNSGIPLMWMENEARAVGLFFKQRSSETTWNPEELAELPTPSMSPVWHMLEYLPLAAWKSFDDTKWTDNHMVKSVKSMGLSKLQAARSNSWVDRPVSFLSRVRLPSSIHPALSMTFRIAILLLMLRVVWRHLSRSLLCMVLFMVYYAYSNASKEGKTIAPHLSRGRRILDGQLIHASVAFKPKDYIPKANFATPLDWDRIVGTVAIKEGNYPALTWPPDLEGRLEKDLFDESFVKDTLEEFLQKPKDRKALLQQLSFMALAVNGADILAGSAEFIDTIISVIKDQSEEQYLDCLCRIAKHTNNPEQPLRAFEPLLSQLERQDIQQLGDGDDLSRLRLILTSLVYLLNQVPPNQISQDTSAKAPSLLLNLFDSFTERRSGKRVEVAPLMSIQTVLKPHLPSWLIRYTYWPKAGLARRPVEEKQEEEPRFAFTRKRGAADIINLLTNCMTAGLRNYHLQNDFLEKIATRIPTLHDLLLDKDTQSHAASAMLTIASVEGGPIKIHEARAIDNLIRLVEADDFPSFHSGMQCLNLCLGYSVSNPSDSQRSFQKKVLRSIIPSLVSMFDSTITPRLRTWASLLIRNFYWTIKEDAHAKEEMIMLLREDRTFETLLNLVLNDKADTGLRVISSDCLAFIVDDAKIDISENIPILLNAIEQRPPTDSPQLVMKSLERNGMQLNDLAWIIPGSAAKNFDQRIIVLNVLWATAAQDADVSKLDIPPQRLLEFVTSLLEKGGEDGLFYTTFAWIARLLRHESVRRRLTPPGELVKEVKGDSEEVVPDPNVTNSPLSPSPDSLGQKEAASDTSITNSSSSPDSPSHEEPPADGAQTSSDVGQCHVDFLDSIIDLIDRERSAHTSFWAIQSVSHFIPYQEFQPILQRRQVAEMLLNIMCDKEWSMGCRISASTTLAAILGNEAMATDLSTTKDSMIQKLFGLAQSPAILCTLDEALADCSASQEVLFYRIDVTPHSMALVILPLVILSSLADEITKLWFNKDVVDTFCDVFLSENVTTYVRDLALATVENITPRVDLASLNKLADAVEQPCNSDYRVPWYIESAYGEYVLSKIKERREELTNPTTTSPNISAEANAEDGQQRDGEAHVGKRDGEASVEGSQQRNGEARVGDAQQRDGEANVEDAQGDGGASVEVSEQRNGEASVEDARQHDGEVNVEDAQGDSEERS